MYVLSTEKAPLSDGKTAHLSTVRDHFSGESARPPDPDSVILLTHAAEIALPVCSLPSRGSRPQWRTFVPAVFTASVHPCVHSAGRVGFGYPVPFSPLPAPSERYRQRLHWINRSLIVLCAPVLAATQNRVYIIIVWPELVNPQPLLSAACILPLLLLLFQLLAHLFHDLHAQRGTGSQQRCTGQKFLLLHNGILPLHIRPCFTFIVFYHTGGAVVKRLSPPHHRTVRLFARIRQIIHIFPCLLRKIPCGFDGAKP